MKPTAFWHKHHYKLLEFSTEPRQFRVERILRLKPADEISLRLKLYQPVKGELPLELLKIIASEDSIVASEQDFSRCSVERAMQLDKIWTDTVKMVAVIILKFKPEIEALHKLECPNCPWDGKTIFPEGRHTL